MPTPWRRVGHSFRPVLILRMWMCLEVSQRQIIPLRYVTLSGICL